MDRKQAIIVFSSILICSFLVSLIVSGAIVRNNTRQIALAQENTKPPNAVAAVPPITQDEATPKPAENKTSSNVRDATTSASTPNDTSNVLSVTRVELDKKVPDASVDAIVKQLQDTAYKAICGAAANGEHIEMLKTIIKNGIKNGIDVNAADENGIIPLMYAAMHNQNPEALRILIAAGADVNATTNDGMTPLIFAVGGNPNPDVLRVLIENGANVNAVMENGVTPLIAATKNPTPDVLRILIENGADVNIVLSNGKKALDFANENENLRGTDAYKLLQQKTHPR